MGKFGPDECPACGADAIEKNLEVQGFRCKACDEVYKNIDELIRRKIAQWKIEQVKRDLKEGGKK